VLQGMFGPVLQEIQTGKASLALLVGLCLISVALSQMGQVNQEQKSDSLLVRTTHLCDEKECGCQEMPEKPFRIARTQLTRKKTTISV